MTERRHSIAEARAYTCGFAFSVDRASVLLVRKTHPAWQAGNWNGVGGKIEGGERAHSAMLREFYEETGIATLSWSPVAVLRGGPITVHFFYAATDIDFVAHLVSHNDAGEPLRAWPVAGLPEHCIDDVRWLVPLCLCPGIVWPVEARFRPPVAEVAPDGAGR